MKVTLPLAVLVAAVLANPAQASDFGVCRQDELTTSSLTREHADLGRGIVTHIGVGFGFGISIETRSIEACATGDALHATYRVEQHYDEPVVQRRPFDVSEDFGSVWTNAVESDEKVTLDLLEQRFIALGAEVRRSTAEWESCACHVAYPRLRGSKKKYDRTR